MAFQTAADVARTKQISDWKWNTLRAVDAFLAQHPGLHRGDSNRQLLVDRTCDFLGIKPGETPITTNDVAMTYGANEYYFRKALSWVTPEKQKEALINEVCELLKSPDGTCRGGKFSDADLKNERNKLAFWDVDQIIARRNEIRLKQSLAPKSAAEIREGLREYHASQQPGVKGLPAEWTKSRLQDPSTSSETLKSLIRRFGIEAVNDRLCGRG